VDQLPSALKLEIPCIQIMIDHFPMAMLDLVFGGKTFPVPKKSVFQLVRHRQLFEAKSYAVQSSVPAEVFEAFVDSLKTQTKISVTQGNAVSVWFLAKEFFLSDVAAECITFSVPVDQFGSLFERVSDLERQVSPFSKPTRQIEEEILSQEEELESLRLALDNVNISLEEELGQLRNDLKQRQATSKPSASPSPSQPPKAPKSPTSVPAQQPTSKPSASPGPSAKPQKSVEIPMKEAESLDGIISYLTTKRGGNVQEKGIVTISSKSVRDHEPKFALKNVADLTSGSCFESKDEPGQWVCWDFREMRVRPTHYTIWTWHLKSWDVEGSLDGRSWTEIDRQTDNQDFKIGWNTASFAVSNPAEFRFIRLTQTGMDHGCFDTLWLLAVEFFGTVSE
jgi:cell division septation protein DedD